MVTTHVASHESIRASMNSLNNTPLMPNGNQQKTRNKRNDIGGNGMKAFTVKRERDEREASQSDVAGETCRRMRGNKKTGWKRRRKASKASTPTRRRNEKREKNEQTRNSKKTVRTPKKTVTFGSREGDTDALIPTTDGGAAHDLNWRHIGTLLMTIQPQPRLLSAMQFASLRIA